MTLVCDQCGHVDPHTTGPVVSVPYQPVGTTTHVAGGLPTQECARVTCFCNLYVPRDLLLTEPAL